MLSPFGCYIFLRSFSYISRNEDLFLSEVLGEKYYCNGEREEARESERAEKERNIIFNVVVKDTSLVMENPKK